MAQILLNFILNIVECQLLPAEDSPAYVIFWAINVFFSSIFSCELLLKLACTWFRDFVTDPWNWFDLLVIALSWAFLFLGSEGQVLVFIRILRALRIAGLIRRIKVTDNQLAFFTIAFLTI